MFVSEVDCIPRISVVDCKLTSFLGTDQNISSEFAETVATSRGRTSHDFVTEFTSVVGDRVLRYESTNRRVNVAIHRRHVDRTLCC